MKLFCDEIESIEKCAECFVNANLHGNWFSMVCSKPHLVLWAKFAGFPLWPCKLMNFDGHTAYVRFFGDHKHAKVGIKNCFLFSRVTTRTTKKSLADALHVSHFNPSINIQLKIFSIFIFKEADAYIRNLSSALGGIFVYADAKTPFDPSKLDEYLANMVIEAIELQELPEPSASSNPTNEAPPSSHPEKVASPTISSPNRKRKPSETDDQSLNAEPTTSESVSSSSDVPKIGKRRKSVQFALDRNETITIKRHEPNEEPAHSVIKRALLSDEPQQQQRLVVSNDGPQSVPKMMEAVILNQISNRSCDTAAIISELNPILHEIAASTNCNGMNREQSVNHADRFNDEINRIRAELQVREMRAKVSDIQKTHTNEMEHLRAYYEMKMAAMTTEHNLKLTEMKSKQWCQSCGKASASTYCCDRKCHDIFE